MTFVTRVSGGKNLETCHGVLSDWVQNGAKNCMKSLLESYSLYFCLQRAADNLIFGSKHDWKIAMLSAWFGAFFDGNDDWKEPFTRQN